MKPNLTLCLILFLSLILSACGGDPARKAARSALEETIRADRAGIDTTDITILEPALAYYRNHGDVESRMKTWYYLGRIQFNQGAYTQAIVSYEKAARWADTLLQPHYAGLIRRGMADTYNRTYNIREDTLYLRRADRLFQAAGDSLHALETRYRLAQACQNDRKWTRARALYEQVLADSSCTGRLRARCLSAYATLLVDLPVPEPGLALTSFRQAAALSPGMTADRWCDLAYAFFLDGDNVTADRILSQTEASAGRTPHLAYRRFCILKQEGRWEEALRCLERDAQAQDSVVRSELTQAVSAAQRDYFAAALREEQILLESGRRQRAGVALLGGLLLVAAGLTAVLCVRREKERSASVQQALCEAERLVVLLQETERKHRNKIHSLNHSLRTNQNALATLRSEHLLRFRAEFKRLGDLFQARQFADTQSHSETVLYRRVGQLLRDIDGDEEGFSRLMQTIEDSLGHPVSSLRQDLPGLGKEHVRLFCYLVIGYDASLISLLLGIDNINTIYSRKNRLLRRIRTLPAAKARRYLDLIS